MIVTDRVRAGGLADGMYAQRAAAPGFLCCMNLLCWMSLLCVIAESGVVQAQVPAALPGGGLSGDGLSARGTTSELVPPTPADSVIAQRKQAAVALNYSRAALHRIRKNPSYRVLQEEQQKILNHLNLNGVADEEVLKLYSSVLDEINQVHLADAEKVILEDKYRRAFRSNVTLNAFTLAGQVATAQFVSAVRTGASSWWDYRATGINRELDGFRVDKERMTSVVSKSSQFLDISWKMARARQIPDRWLVRSDDLDRLEEAWAEPDLAVRLRVLKRMEPFMECYPPYWYYLARTEQLAGQLFAAAQTYAQLSDLGRGHFRKDEMLAAGLANRALIQAYLNQTGADESALAALEYSTDVWEANLVCGAVLQRCQRYDVAEDAIFRNLDVKLERTQSNVALLSLYHQSQQHEKLAARLADPTIIAEVPPSSLASYAALLGVERTPAAVLARLQNSLRATTRLNFGRDDVLIAASPQWQIPQAQQITLHWGDQTFSQPRLTTTSTGLLLGFEGITELGGPLQSAASGTEPEQLALSLTYPDQPPIRIGLSRRYPEFIAPGETAPARLTARRQPIYRMTSFQQETQLLSWLPDSMNRGPGGDSQPPTGLAQFGPTALPQLEGLIEPIDPLEPVQSGQPEFLSPESPQLESPRTAVAGAASQQATTTLKPVSQTGPTGEHPRGIIEGVVVPQQP